MVKQVKIGFIPANRGFFSNALAAEMRAKTIEALEKQGIEVIVPNDTDRPMSAVSKAIKKRRSSARCSATPTWTASWSARSTSATSRAWR